MGGWASPAPTCASTEGVALFFPRAAAAVVDMKVRSLLGIGSGGILVGLGVFGALAALAAERGLWVPPADLPRALALVALLGALVVLVAVAHALLRRDLTRAERVVLVLGMALVPVGGIAYWALGEERTRAFARRVVAMFEPERPARPSL